MSSPTENMIKAFSDQAASYHDYEDNPFINAFCNQAIEAMKLNGHETVLEVAAGTCAFGRMIAPSVQEVVEFDLTEAMLNVGKTANEKAGIENVSYVVGNAESIPYEDGHFDAVVTRLSFHHFENAEKVMSELARVLRTGGRMAVIDMIHPVEESRKESAGSGHSHAESHMHGITAEELTDMAKKYGIGDIKTEEDIIPMEHPSRMERTDASDKAQKEIKEDLHADVSGSVSPGMDPHMEEGHIMSRRHWVYVVGRKTMRILE